MIYGVEKRMATLRNELKAQKVYSGLTYSQLLMPTNTPQLSYTGMATWDSSTKSIIARIRFRFTRTDGLVDPPLINFTHTSNISPTYKEYIQSNGFTITPNINMSYFDSKNIEAYIASEGDGYIDYYVDFKSSIIDSFFTLNSIQISTTCQAVANVYGVMTMERLV